MSSGGDEPPAPVASKFETVSWYNRYSMNSTIGPLVVGRTVLYGGTYAYQNTKASKLAALDATTGMARWRMDYGAAFGPMVLQGGMIAVAAGDSVLGLDLGSGIQRWSVPIQPRLLTAAGDVVLVAERETIRAIDLASGTQPWQATSTTDPVAAGDTALFMDGRTLRAVAADDTLYFTTQSASGTYVFHAFDPATQKDRWSRPLDSSSRVAPIVMGTLVATASNSSAETLVALSRGTGTVAWSARADSVPVQPVLKGNVLYVAGQGPNRIYAFEAGTGAVLWSGRLWGWPMGMALTEDGMLLVSADNLTLYAYQTR